jgi:aminopeptidase
MTYLNSMRFRRLHYSAPGTNLTIDLPAGHRWLGGDAGEHNGAKFVPNLPTEEVFSLPARTGVNGTVRSTIPLNYNGVPIEGIRLTLEGGRIVAFAADKGEEALKGIIETDEGSRYLGEIALVPVNSPVNTGTPILSTLFDENASCHIAIGRAYPICVEGGEGMTPDELTAHGVNISDAHVDFMIGSAELNIDGETASGERTPIFRNGLWAEEVAARPA